MAEAEKILLELTLDAETAAEYRAGRIGQSTAVELASEVRDVHAQPRGKTASAIAKVIDVQVCECPEKRYYVDVDDCSLSVYRPDGSMEHLDAELDRWCEDCETERWAREEATSC